MRRALKQVTDFLFPLHKDAAAAERITSEEVMEFFFIKCYKNPLVYTALPYHDKGVQTLIKANKFHKSTHAAEVLAGVLEETVVSVLEDRALESGWQEALVVPIPASRKRLRERGYNQIERIIEKLPKETLGQFRYVPHMLKRHDRKSQAFLSKQERAQNIAGAFFVPQNYGSPRSIVLGAHVLLIDDVSESGATMKDAMRALKTAGAKKIIGIALAK